MKYLFFFALLFAAIPANASPEINQPAPTFRASDSDGNIQNLADYKGKFVVLEWLNHGCPFVKKFYDVGHMQKLQKECTDKDIIWLSIVSSAPDKQGHQSPEDTNKTRDEKNARPTAIILDKDGAIGRLYNAKVTPHMFVINPEGNLIYAGAIDDKKSTDSSDIPTSTNYVQQALDEALAGKPVSIPASKAYGCSIKYN